MPAPRGSEVWRDYASDGIPSSGLHEPKKPQIRSWTAWLESLVTSGVLSSGPWFATKEVMTLGYAANTIAVVYDDTTASENGLYIKVGASGSGSWTQLTTFLPGYQFVTASPTDDSTANAIVATTSPRLPAGDGVALVTLVIPETNTGSPVTVSFNGGSPLTIKTNTGNDVAAGGLVAGMQVLGRMSGSTFRLVSDQVSAAIIAEAESILSQVQEVRDEVLGAVPASYVSTRAQAKAIDPLMANAVYLTETGREGLWLIKSGTPPVTDESEGIYVLSDTAGYYLERVYTGPRMLSWFADPDASDHVAALSDAFKNVAGGGVDVVSNIPKIRINSADFTIPQGCSLLGPHETPGEILPGSAADYDGLNGVIEIASTRSIICAQRATISGFVIMRQGLNLPFADASAATAGLAAFAGTACKTAGPDAKFENLLILGFEYGVYSTGFERLRCYNVYGDCLNGIFCETSYDVAYIEQCHFWPYTTVHQSWTTNALLRRSGTAFKLQNVGDWTKVSDCFSYGYFRGFWSENCNEVTFVSCGADNTSSGGVGDHAGSFGFLATAGSKRAKFISCQTAAQQAGYYIDNGAGNTAILSECTAWASVTTGVQVVSGDATITGGELSEGQYGMQVANSASIVSIDDVTFRGQSARPIFASPTTVNLYVGENNKFPGWASHAVEGTAIPTIASADPLAIPPTGNAFFVSGNTSFGSFTGMWPGRRITLIFTGTPTVTHSGGGIVLAGSANYIVTAGSSLDLIGRSAVGATEIGRAKV